MRVVVVLETSLDHEKQDDAHDTDPGPKVYRVNQRLLSDYSC